MRLTTLAQFRTAVANKIGLDNSASGDQPSIDLWVNEGVTDVVLRTRSQVRSATATMTTGTGDYTLSTSILQIIDLETSSSGSTYPMTRVTPDDIKAMRRSATTNTSPSQYYALAGSDLLMVYPPPGGNDTVTFTYVPRPATLSITSDSPAEIPVEWHKAVEYYALWQAGDYDDDQSSAQGERYRQVYEQYLARMRRQFALKGNNRLPRARVQPLVRYVPHDRSTYP